MDDKINSIHSAQNTQRKIKETFYKATSFLLTIFALFELVAIVVLYSQQKIEIPYVIEISREGDVKYKKDIALELANWTPSTATKIKILKDYITDLRSICADEHMQVKMIKNIYAFSVENGLKEAEKYLLETDPLSRVGKERVDIDVYATTPMINDDENVFQIDWNEKTYSPAGALLSEQNFRAVIKTKYFTVKTHEMQTINPLGLYICDIKTSAIKDGYTINDNK